MSVEYDAYQASRSISAQLDRAGYLPGQNGVMTQVAGVTWLVDEIERLRGLLDKRDARSAHLANANPAPGTVIETSNSNFAIYRGNDLVNCGCNIEVDVARVNAAVPGVPIEEIERRFVSENWEQTSYWWFPKKLSDCAFIGGGEPWTPHVLR